MIKRNHIRNKIKLALLFFFTLTLASCGYNEPESSRYSFYLINRSNVDLKVVCFFDENNLDSCVKNLRHNPDNMFEKKDAGY